ncbi:MAG TPA: AlpA family transcriptional regulator [Burkholderiales bacterium]|nr:AlpA family transcriptional regulator [Burkholderiales bacterium]
MKQVHNNQASQHRAVDTRDASLREKDGARILRFKQVAALVGLGKSSIYRKVQEGTFPKPIKLGSARASGWISTEVYDWIDDQVRRSRKAA